jgi:hypothetical protein
MGVPLYTTAPRLSEETRYFDDVGLRGCFWENPNGRYINERGQDPFYLRRMGSDFLPLLPGNGRNTILSLFATKLRRRLRNSAPYLTH